MRLPGRLAVAAATISLVGCYASFSERPRFPDYSGPSKPLTAVVSTFERDLLYLHPERWVEMPDFGFLVGAASDAIARSGWVLEVAEDERLPELWVSVVHYQGPGPGLLSVLSAFVIPGVTDHRIDVEVGVRHPDGRLRKCDRSVETRTWHQTLLIFAYPFRPPSHGKAKSVEALALSCLAEILQEIDRPDAA